MIVAGVIGYGYWGPNLVRNFNAQSNCRLKWVSDRRTDRLELVKRNYPSIQITNDYKDLLNDKELDAVVIATPVYLHYPLAKEALLKGKHVLVEKPIATNSAQAEELISLAQKMGKVLMVDHTFLYTGAVQKIKSSVESGLIGDMRYFDSTRINLGLFQPDINVIWDLAPHDISILDFLVNEKPVAISATGVAHMNNNIENIAYLTVFYQSNFIAHFSCSWTSPVKIRKILIGGSKKMILFDDVEPTEKVKIYDTSYSMNSDEEKHKMLVDYRVGDIYIPKVDQREALNGMAADFINSIEKGSKPLSDGILGLNVVKILEASEVSLKNKGKEVKLN